MKKKDINKYIENIIESQDLVDHRSDRNIFSIDPLKSKDFDDAFSIETLENNTTRISIYISNVAIWLDALELWSSFSNRISTIYLPDRKRPMLPTILCDAICSLVEGNLRIAFTLEMRINEETHGIVDTNLLNTLIPV